MAAILQKKQTVAARSLKKFFRELLHIRSKILETNRCTFIGKASSTAAARSSGESLHIRRETIMESRCIFIRKSSKKAPVRQLGKYL